MEKKKAPVPVPKPVPVLPSPRSVPAASTPAAAPRPDARYKTELCQHYLRSGGGGGCCPFGTACHFAHGTHELRPLTPRDLAAAASAGAGGAARDCDLHRVRPCPTFVSTGSW